MNELCAKALMGAIDVMINHRVTTKGLAGSLATLLPLHKLQSYSSVERSTPDLAQPDIQIHLISFFS